jgi:hypothetical protein
MIGKALQFPTSMPLSVWGIATQLCPQLPPQSGISYVTDYIDLIVDDCFGCTDGWQGLLACQLSEQRFGFLSLDFSQILY